MVKSAVGPISVLLFAAIDYHLGIADGSAQMGILAELSTSEQDS